MSICAQILLDTQRAKELLEDVNTRRDDIMKIEASINELQSIFADLARIVAYQVKFDLIFLNIFKNTFRVIWSIRLRSMCPKQRKLSMRQKWTRERRKLLKTRIERWTTFRTIRKEQT
jgi:hypothetical protein